MAGNEIRNEGAKALSEMLKVNTTLKTLDLSGEEKERSEKRKKRDSRTDNRQ